MATASAYGKPVEVYGFQTLYREIGYYISRLEQYESALKFFDEALRKTPNDKRALTGRSKARAMVSQYEGALQDIIKALDLDPDDLVVLADKALNTYLCCQFEEGLIQNIRLLPKRQKPDNFAMGVMQCSDAIENCIGERSGRPLRDYFKIIRKLAWKKNYAAHKPFEPKPSKGPKKKKTHVLGRTPTNEDTNEPVQPKFKRTKALQSESNLQIRDSLHSNPKDEEPVPPYSKPFPFKPLQNYTTNIENYMAEKYLDSMYIDKMFLRKLQSEPGANSPNTEGSIKIKQLAKSAFKTVSYKQEILRTRRPFYFIKYQEGTVSGALRARQKMELKHQQENTRLEAETLMNKMITSYTEKNLKELLESVKKIKQFCDGKPKKLLPDKMIYMNQVYETVCKGWYEFYRVNASHAPFEQEKRIYAIFGLPLNRMPSSDSVVAQFKDVFIDYKKEIIRLEHILKEAVVPQEICWFYHDLARYQFEIKNYDLSRAYARKCIYEAKTVNNPFWNFNSIMVMVKCHLAEHNKNDARNELLNAKSCVEHLNDTEKLDYILKCLNVVETVEFEDAFGEKQLELRENKIIEMMASSKMKDEVAHLFRQMAAMPSSRRMMLIPGVRAQEKQVPSKSLKSRTMSIMQGPKSSNTDDLKLARQSKNPASESRVKMMDLIEYHL